MRCDGWPRQCWPSPRPVPGASRAGSRGGRRGADPRGSPFLTRAGTAGPVGGPLPIARGAGQSAAHTTGREGRLARSTRPGRPAVSGRAPFPVPAPGLLAVGRPGLPPAGCCGGRLAGLGVSAAWLPVLAGWRLAGWLAAGWLAARLAGLAAGLSRLGCLARGGAGWAAGRARAGCPCCPLPLGAPVVVGWGEPEPELRAHPPTPTGTRPEPIRQRSGNFHVTARRRHLDFQPPQQNPARKNAAPGTRDRNATTRVNCGVDLRRGPRASPTTTIRRSRAPSSDSGNVAEPGDSTGHRHPARGLHKPRYQ
jgi:hypothetical protein